MPNEQPANTTPSRGSDRTSGPLTSLALSLTLAVAGCGGQPQAAATNDAAKSSYGLSPEQAVDYIQRVIFADRKVYASRVVERLQDQEAVIEATEHFEEEKTLPLPAQMLRMGAEEASQEGGFRYALISKWAINKANSPKTEFEEAGLEAVIADPSKPFTRYETIAGQRYFLALYPDKAVSLACVQCHNDHEESPRDDFELGDVMGGVVISLPLGAR